MNYNKKNYIFVNVCVAKFKENHLLENDIKNLKGKKIFKKKFHILIKFLLKFKKEIFYIKIYDFNNIFIKI